MCARELQLTLSIKCRYISDDLQINLNLWLFPTTSKLMATDLIQFTHQSSGTLYLFILDQLTVLIILNLNLKRIYLN